MDYSTFMDFKKGKVTPTEAHTEWEHIKENTDPNMRAWNGKKDANGKPSMQLPIIVDSWWEGEDAMISERAFEKRTNDIKKPVSDEQVGTMESAVGQGHRGFGAAAFAGLGGGIAKAHGYGSGIGLGSSDDAGDNAGADMAPEVFATPAKRRKSEQTGGGGGLLSDAQGSSPPPQSWSPSGGGDKDDKAFKAQADEANRLPFAIMSAADRMKTSVESLRKKVQKSVEETNRYVESLNADIKHGVQRYCDIMANRVRVLNALLESADVQQMQATFDSLQPRPFLNMDLLVTMKSMSEFPSKVEHCVSVSAVSEEEQKFTREYSRIQELADSMTSGITEVKRAVTQYNKKVAAQEPCIYIFILFPGR